MIDKFQIEKLSALPIEGVARSLGFEVSRHRCLCPFHADRHPSLTFDTRHNRFRCFVCGEYGRPIDLVMKARHLSFPEACEWLAGERFCPPSVPPNPVGTTQPDTQNGVEVSRYAHFFEHPVLSPEAQHFLFDVRKLDPEVIRQCRLNSYRDRQGVNWLQIPYYDTEGRLIGIQNRNLGPTTNPRFRFPRGSRCTIYNLPILNQLRPGDSLYIAEGCSDCWSLLSAGHKAIAIPSATLLKPEDIALFTPNSSSLTPNYHMYPDQDEAGERLFLQLRQLLPSLIRHQLPIGCKDYSDYYLKGKE